ncbi:DNA mismatch repair endonuclease MutL [Persephonella sp.]
MIKIKPLPDHLVRKIAAGEVIERPSNILKELIENSIDAGSDRIDIFLEKGGKRLIQVVDNGEGIHPDDMLDCVKRYTTSKISSEEDLYSISSYGFRGEALYSICSVSKFSIVSRPEDLSVGKELYIEGGVFKSFTDTGAPIGTKVRVKDLFFNTPVRRRFLKSERTEFLHCLRTFINYALVRTDIHFRFYHNGKELMNLPPSDLRKRISYIYPELSNRLIKIDYSDGTGRIYGYLSLDERFKKEGILFVNKRPVRNRELKKIIKSLVSEKFYVLFIDLPPYFVDHNVHPAKIEVKFKSDAAVKNLIREGLRGIESPFKKLSIDYTVSQKKESYKTEKAFSFLGQIEETFLVVYFDGDLYLIDQHVVDERINYEILMEDILKNGSVRRKILDREIKRSISELEKALIEDKKDLLERSGFSFNLYGYDLVIKEIPVFVSKERALDIFFRILMDEDAETVDYVIGEIACKLSVKSGDLLSDEKAKLILKRWLETDSPNLCPHGRPVYYKISIDDVKKAIGRG